MTQTEAELSVSPSNARIIARLAVYQAKAGNDAAALKSLQRALDLAPNDGEVLQRAGVVHALAGRTTEALEAVEKAVGGGISSRSIADEEDFARLRSLPRFVAVISTPAEVKR